MSTIILKNSFKREGQCAIRSAGGMPILDETYSYIVVATAKDEPYVNVITTSGIPLPGITVSPSGFGLCKTSNATRRTDNPYYWDVTCQFSSEVEERSSEQDPSTDPTAWVPIYETKFERLQEVVTKDLDGTAIANSAGQAFPTGLTISRFIPVWEFFQLEAAVSDETIIERNETINLSTFKGRDPETLLLTIVSSVVGFYYGQRRRLTQYSLKYNDRKWTHKRLDTGTVYLVGTSRKGYYDNGGPDGEPKRIFNGPLDGSGGKAAAGDPPATLEFDIYRKISFSFLRV